MEVMTLFTDKAQSLAIMLHTMNVMKAVVEHLDPGQIQFLVAGAPIYAFLKKIQFTMLDTHGEEKLFITMGGLHIELAAFRMAGKWLEGSGFTSVLIDAGVTTQRKADYVLKVSHIKISRYSHEVTAAAIRLLQQLDYQEHKLNDTDLLLRVVSPMLQYRDIVLKIELCILTILRSIREANFQLYMNTLIPLAPWFIALDHTNYARWLSVHIRDLIHIECERLDIAQVFKAGRIVAWKTMRPFSATALDHVLSNTDRTNLTDLTPYHHEEVGTWILRSCFTLLIQELQDTSRSWSRQ
ncbi:hypothetical protein PR048_002100 [Dryococelus australis]|uniref:Uncharacterized protein n=1 Tax=Dryococelus australis TaxID=614101 RepID=A0ABQ9IKR5_9NEOP|nr:hypothetical protein PR048_002100 [Dryococelus australis]